MPVDMAPSATANLAAWLTRAALRWPRLAAVALGDRALWDYEALATRAGRLAEALRSAGLRSGDRVALLSRNVPEYVEALFACWWAGLVAVPVNAKLHPREVGYILNDCGARLALTDAAWESHLATLTGEAFALEHVVAFNRGQYRAWVETSDVAPVAAVSTDTAAWLFYTSGTTGHPKGVILTHGNLRAMTRCFLTDVEAIAPGDAILHPAPLSHGSGLYAIPHVARGAVHVMPESGGFDPPEIFASLGAWRRALFFAAPTMVKRLVSAPALSAARLDRLKCIVFGGGPMYVEDCKAAFAALGPRLAQIYGQGETPMTITAMDRATLADAIARRDDLRLASVGVAQTGIDVRIADETDSSLPAESIGEVVVRGDTVMQGYWGNPEATSEALAGGWLHTGDLGALDDRGFLTLKDRSKDLIISGGSNIYPREVEEALLAHPDVAEAAIVGRRHAEWGEEVVAFVVARVYRADDESLRTLEAALDRHCLERIARFKRPKAYVFVDELPKNDTGKVLKTALREELGPVSTMDANANGWPGAPIKAADEAKTGRLR